MHKSKGFSLMELMVALAITGVLLAIAVPSYQSYAQNSRRAVAASCLVELSQFMERVYTSSMSYNINNNADTVLPDTQCQQTLAEFYGFALDAEPQTYTLSATPKGGQTSDTACGTLTIDQAGTRTAAGSSAAATVRECWN